MTEYVKFNAEVVNGICPTCEETTLLVSVSKDYYRCITCGTDLEQHINGKISYLPVVSLGKTGKKPYVKQWEDG